MALEGIMALIIGVVVIVLTVLAIFMPYFIYKIHCNMVELVKEKKKTNSLLKQISAEKDLQAVSVIG